MENLLVLAGIVILLFFGASWEVLDMAGKIAGWKARWKGDH
jgi:hypothetical protein